MVKKIDLSKSPEFWNLNETNGYKYIKAIDGNRYKVWVGDESEPEQKKWWFDAENVQDVADTLAKAKQDILTLLIYIEQNPHLWNQHPIAFGIYHTLDLHLYKPFEYLEMRPNTFGILGLNKPKEISVIKADLDNKTIDYELGTKRNILLTIRNQNTGKIKNYQDILDLAIHELTHTTCNDVRWVPESQGGNHREPYPTYHKLMRKMARLAGLKISNKNII
jgi:hypothetical protein